MTIVTRNECAQKTGSWSFELPWPPVTGNKAVRHTRTGGHYKTREALTYEAVVAQIVAAMGVGSLIGQKPLQGPLSVEWTLAPPDKRSRDVDNVRKVAADALTRAGFWKDDSNKVLVREVFDWTEAMPEGAIHLSVEVLA